MYVIKPLEELVCVLNHVWKSIAKLVLRIREEREGERVKLQVYTLLSSSVVSLGRRLAWLCSGFKS